MGKQRSLRYIESARSDLLDIADYISAQAMERDAANRLVDGLERAILRLESFPFSGFPYEKAVGLKEEYRILVFGNYLVFYAVFDDSVEIRRIIHSKRSLFDVMRSFP